jgi:multidrug resistance efflux pump
MGMRIQPASTDQLVARTNSDHAATVAPAEEREPKTQPAGGTRRRPSLRRVLLFATPIVLAAAAYVGYSMYRESVLYVSTENAQVAGQPVQVGAMNAGRVARVTVSLGGTVRRGDPLADLALPSQVGTAQNGQPKLGFLGTADSHIDVVAPIDGVVLALPAAVGSTVAAGQPIATILDPNQLWVNANVEETNVERVKVGQSVQVHIDGFNQEVVGRVDAITPGTASSFSLLPSNSASGNFTKVVQLVPVRISINLSNRPALLGSSAEVKIRVAD